MKIKGSDYLPDFNEDVVLNQYVDLVAQAMEDGTSGGWVRFSRELKMSKTGKHLPVIGYRQPHYESITRSSRRRVKIITSPSGDVFAPLAHKEHCVQVAQKF